MDLENLEIEEENQIKELENRRTLLTTERDELVNKKSSLLNIFGRNNTKKRITEIENELKGIDTQLEGLKTSKSTEDVPDVPEQAVSDESSTNVTPSSSMPGTPKPDVSDAKIPKKEVHIDDQAGKIIEFYKDPQIDSDHMKIKIEEMKPCLAGDVKICKECKRPITPCDKIFSKKSFSSHGSIDNASIRKSCSQSKSPSKHQLVSKCSVQNPSKTCINCGKRYRDANMSMNATTSRCSFHKDKRPQNQSITNSQASSRNKAYEISKHDRNQELPVRSKSKCSLNQTQSIKSLAPCQSFVQCRKCNELLFSKEPSCDDICDECKHSTDDCSHNAQNSQSRAFKARNVNFDVNQEFPRIKSISDVFMQNEKVIRSDNYCNDSVKNEDFCGCSTVLDCKSPCEPQDSCGNNGSADECDELRRKLKDLETFVPKEPAQLSMAKSLLEHRFAACSTEKVEKRQSRVSKKIDLTKPRLHRVKKPTDEFDDLACPSNPCCMSEKKREKMEKLTQKMIQREGNRQKDIKGKKQAHLMKLLGEKCVANEECKVDTKCDEETDDCVDYSKKYQKMKYFIEMQNYLVEKLNRDLQMKISKNFPNSVLIEDRCSLEREVNKLREMVEYTIFEQCRNKNLKWGTIPVSQLTSGITQKVKCPQSVPRTPSGISNVSAFSMLEELKLSQEKERYELQTKVKLNKDRNVQELIREIQNMECVISKLKCDHEKLSKSLAMLDASDTTIVPNKCKVQELENIKFKMEDIVSQIHATKDDIDFFHTKIHYIKESEH